MDPATTPLRYDLCRIDELRPGDITPWYEVLEDPVADEHVEGWFHVVVHMHAYPVEGVEPKTRSELRAHGGDSVPIEPRRENP